MFFDSVKSIRCSPYLTRVDEKHFETDDITIFNIFLWPREHKFKMIGDRWVFKFLRLSVEAALLLL